MTAISVEQLSKYYRVPQKKPGMVGSLQALVSRRWREVHAVENISFLIQPGELVGFLGPNGAGKTTTLKVLSGLLHPTSGRVDVLGHQPWRRQKEFQKSFSLVMGQRNQLWWDLPAQESLKLNKEIYEVPDSLYRQTLQELKDLLELENLLDIPVKKLSLGQRMKAEFCAALLHQPQVLFLDEPTIGLDVVMQKKIRQFIRDYNQRFGATIILTSHNMDDVSELCQRIIIIDHGRILYDGALEKIVSQFATHKLVTVDVDSAPQNSWEDYGTVLEKNETRAVLQIPRKQVSAATAKILRDHPVRDLTIEDIPIDEIIRKIFQKGLP